MRKPEVEIVGLTSTELLRLHAAISAELRTRGVTRTANGPTGDLAEYLFCKAFGWTQSSNSHPNVDAVDLQGVRYQIKGRRKTRLRGSRQLGAIRDFPLRHFDVLTAVLFDDDFSVHRAALVPYAVVQQRATFVPRTNSHKFHLLDDVWDTPSVVDVTESLRAVDI